MIDIFKDPARLFDFCFGKKFYPLLLEKTNRNIQMIYDSNGPEYKPGQESSHLSGTAYPRSRRDSLISDFMGRRPLPVRDYVVSINDGPKL